MQLTIENLTKTYSNGVKTLDHLNLTIEKGMFGLLGPNGAGKSSLMRTIATLQMADSGSVRFGDIDAFQSPMQLRKILGYLPQDFGVYQGVSAEKLLDYFAILKGITNKQQRKSIVAEVLELTNLYEVRKKSVSGYSGGMRQRFGIAQLLLNRPKLLIVDEPTAGLDPAERNRFLNVLRAVGTESTVIFSTHFVEDVKDLCTDMAMMQNGQIIKKTTPQQAIQELDGKIWSKVIEPAQLGEYENRFSVLSSGYEVNNELFVRVYAGSLPDASFSPTSPDLEDAYFWAMKYS